MMNQRLSMKARQRARLLVGAQHGAPNGAILVPEGAKPELGVEGSVLFQGEDDVVHLAIHLGWGGDCACCMSNPNAYGEAWAWLQERDEEIFQDPGYLRVVA